MDNRFQCRTVAELMAGLEDVQVRNKRGAHLRFRMYMTKEMQEAPLEVLDLSVRSEQCLKRSGSKTVGDVVYAIGSGLDLKNIRNCGAISVREIQEHLFLFQYYSLPKEKQDAFLIEVVLLNTIFSKGD